MYRSISVNWLVNCFLSHLYCYNKNTLTLGLQFFGGFVCLFVLLPITLDQGNNTDKHV